MTNRKSTTGFPTSCRRSAYVTPKSRKGWFEKRFFCIAKSSSQGYWNKQACMCVLIGALTVDSIDLEGCFGFGSQLHLGLSRSVSSIRSWGQGQGHMMVTMYSHAAFDWNAILLNRGYMWNKIICEIILKLFHCFISHETEIKLFQPLKLFQNYSSDIEHVGK